MAVSKIRLFKIASEINIGKDAIVEFLQTKGFKVENKPTTKLSEEMLDAVYDKFKKEKRAVELQRTKIQKHKDARLPKEEIPEPIVEVVEIIEEKVSTEEQVIVKEAEPEVMVEEEVPIQPVVEQEIPVTIMEDDAVAEEIVEAEPEVVEEELQSKIIEVEADKHEPQELGKINGIETRSKGKNLKGLTIVGKITVEERRKKPRDPATDGKSTDDGEKKERKRKFRKIDLSTPRANPQGVQSEDRKIRKRKRSIRSQISPEDVSKAIKSTFATMDETGGRGASRAKVKQKKKAEREEKELIVQEEQEKQEKILELTEFVTTSDLAGIMRISTSDIILKCMELGLMVTINQRLDKDTITLIADDYGFDVEFVDEEAAQYFEDIEDAPETLKPRPPIVTIMGHVDHGKTSLLDHIRNESVVAGEAGGITQHMGAYMVEKNDRLITFLDTPGHEAFTAMRARGAQVTDIVILVVAADDSVMPQTLEAISHAKAAAVPIIIAINKIDKPDANPDRIKQQLSDNDILVEEWGGKYQSVEISAKQGINIDKLLESIILESELLELKANPDRIARGTVIEAHVDKGLGVVSTVVIQKGTLTMGASFVAGTANGRVRSMFDERDHKLNIAGPSHPIRVVGFDGTPNAGDMFFVVNSESEARSIANEKKILRREQELRQVRLTTLDDISRSIKLGGIQKLFLIVKADVAGSVEALSDSLLKLSHDEVQIVILHKGVGNITENDVNLAMASGAVIVGFHVKATGKAQKLAKNENVDVRYYDIIYDCINEMELALEGMLAPEITQEVTATIEVRDLFKMKKTTIAGCYVQSGKIHRNDRIKVIRDGFSVFEGKIASLKRIKDDVTEVNAKFECGIVLDGFNNIQVDDIIEGYKTVETKRTLKKK